ncbi:MAG: phosphoesterase, partial [Chloroflexi bacterium]
MGRLPLDVFASARAESQPGDSIVLLWNAAILQGVRESKLGPPMVARALAIAHTCVFDAWAAY